MAAEETAEEKKKKKKKKKFGKPIGDPVGTGCPNYATFKTRLILSPSCSLTADLLASPPIMPIKLQSDDDLLFKSDL